MEQPGQGHRTEAAAGLAEELATRGGDGDRRGGIGGSHTHLGGQAGQGAGSPACPLSYQKARAGGTGNRRDGGRLPG